MTTPYQGEGRRRGRAALLTFVLGLIGGVLTAVLLPPLVRPYLPAALGGRSQVLSGLVVAKGGERGRVLLTLATPQGTTLATFTNEAARVNLLVRTGDSLSLRVERYAPFVENPRITRVVSAEAAPRPLPADTGPAGETAR